MNKETQYIAKSFESTLSGQPWFGRSIYAILEEIDESKVTEKPNADSHSLIELLWHMNTWAAFTLGALENKNSEEMQRIEGDDWRRIDPKIHTWKRGIEHLKTTHKTIIELLRQKESDDFLKEIVTNRQYNFRFLLNGLVQHNIYHLGQVAYVKKLIG